MWWFEDSRFCLSFGNSFHRWSSCYRCNAGWGSSKWAVINHKCLIITVVSQFLLFSVTFNFHRISLRLTNTPCWTTRLGSFIPSIIWPSTMSTILDKLDQMTRWFGCASDSSDKIASDWTLYKSTMLFVTIDLKWEKLFKLNTRQHFWHIQYPIYLMINMLKTFTLTY